jgi:hypothetical protein
MAANFGDLDNDGWLDVYLGLGEASHESLLPKRMFRNDHGRYFQKLTTSGGFGYLQKGHGIAYADIENNGNEEVFEELGGAYPGDRFTSTLHHNPGHGNHWVTLVLEGVKTNRVVFGSRIKVTIEEDGRQRPIYRAVGSVSSFGGNPIRQHVGVGKRLRRSRRSRSGGQFRACGRSSATCRWTGSFTSGKAGMCWIRSCGSRLRLERQRLAAQCKSASSESAWKAGVQLGMDKSAWMNCAGCLRRLGPAGQARQRSG